MLRFLIIFMQVFGKQYINAEKTKAFSFNTITKGSEDFQKDETIMKTRSSASETQAFAVYLVCIC